MKVHNQKRSGLPTLNYLLIRGLNYTRIRGLNYTRIPGSEFILTSGLS